ncbi:hypothetical protein Pmani_025546 [Petrolisthes manimaculis]|uniref:Uncharacterized protein n=1 Tax=Petrolisthes manimaculis TaxID=1843537 RepID=A0AAE1TYT9_9EUCA|nr:hypothetical protein Pmani_025546 [Petrolisthes manimaculis]
MWRLRLSCCALLLPTLVLTHPSHVLHRAQYPSPSQQQPQHLQGPTRNPPILRTSRRYWRPAQFESPETLPNPDSLTQDGLPYKNDYFTGSFAREDMDGDQMFAVGDQENAGLANQNAFFNNQDFLVKDEENGLPVVQNSLADVNDLVPNQSGFETHQNLLSGYQRPTLYRIHTLGNQNGQIDDQNFPPEDLLDPIIRVPGTQINMMAHPDDPSVILSSSDHEDELMDNQNTIDDYSSNILPHQYRIADPNYSDHGPLFQNPRANQNTRNQINRIIYPKVNQNARNQINVISDPRLNQNTRNQIHTIIDPRVNQNTRNQMNAISDFRLNLNARKRRTDPLVTHGKDEAPDYPRTLPAQPRPTLLQDYSIGDGPPLYSQHHQGTGQHTHTFLRDLVRDAIGDEGRLSTILHPHSPPWLKDRPVKRFLGIELPDYIATYSSMRTNNAHYLTKLHQLKQRMRTAGK